MLAIETGRLVEAEEHLRILADVTGVPEAPVPFVTAKIARVTGDTSRLAAADAVVMKMPVSTENPFSWWQMVYHTAAALGAVVRRDTREAAVSAEYFLSKKGFYMATDAGEKSSDGIAALLCTVLGRYGEAMTHFEDALTFCSRGGYKPELAWTYYDYADARITRNEQGDHDHAEALLENGLVIARQLGMRPLVERMKSAQSKLHQGSRKKPSYPAGLTVREVEILRQVARGLTNQEIGKSLFISPLTVAKHIHNILTKTGMSNRAEVTAFAIREGIVETESPESRT
jgi:DNA-binding CsgD family transcriptional regulator